MRKNIITQTDSYKVQHSQMYPDGTEHVYSYFEARPGATLDKTVFFGLQYQMMEYLEGEVVTQEKLSKAIPLLKAHLSLTDDQVIAIMKRWQYIIDEYDGRLPLEIKAVPEGSRIPVNNVLMTVIKTDKKCGWLTNYVETLLTHVDRKSVV